MTVFQLDKPQSRNTVATFLLFLTIFGPISMDLYLPELPALTSELDAATSIAQLTITACLIGLAAGQVLAGPLSDRFGRRTPLLIGIAAYIITSALCAASPTIELLILARFLQGMSGAVGIVMAQATGRDILEGGSLIRFYSKLTVTAGLAAIVGPLVGGQLARYTGWRGMFLFLAAIGLALFMAALLVYRETLPPDRRTRGGLRQVSVGYRRLLADRLFVGSILVTGFANAAIFAYLSGATYILQGIYGLSPQGYSYVFGLTSAGYVTLGYLSGRAAERWSPRGALAAGLLVAGTGALGLLATGVLDVPLAVVIASLIALVGGVAFSSPPTTSLALAGYPDLAGTAASALGLTRYAFGGLAAPLVGLGGAGTALPLGIVTVTAITLALVVFMRLVGPDRGPLVNHRASRRHRDEATGDQRIRSA